MLYHAYEYTHAAMSPLRASAELGMRAMRDPLNPFSAMMPVRATAAAFEMFVNATRRYGKPRFEIESVEVAGEDLDVVEEIVCELPFCDLLHFRRVGALADVRSDPKVLIVAPMSGHYATLLRGTVEAMLPEHDVYITDWRDAREVPVTQGQFGLADYMDYIETFCALLAEDGERPAVMGVCQPGVPVMAMSALMAEDNAPHRPSSIILMGSPIDTRQNPTEPNVLATSRSLAWFEKNMIVVVPWPNMGFTRRVYPGFLQLSGFVSMNLDRHVDAHVDHFRNLVRGDGDSAAAHQAFYDEYMAVMDLSADFYLETIEKVFQKHELANGAFTYRDRLVDPGAIRDIAIMTVEGEKDDITGRGQTEAALPLCPNLPDSKKMPYIQEKVGHYGVFNGSRWRQHIQPKVRDFIRRHRATVRLDAEEAKPASSRRRA